MKKVFELSHTLDMKERQLQKLMKEKTGLVRKEVCHVIVNEGQCALYIIFGRNQTMRSWRNS